MGKDDKMSENKPKFKCETCWKWFIYACPISAEIPKNIISCSAYEPTDVYLKEQEIISDIVEKLRKYLGCEICTSSVKPKTCKSCCGLYPIIEEYEKKLNLVEFNIENKDNKK